MSDMIRGMGHLKQNELDIQQVEIEIKGLLRSINNCLDPFVGIEDLGTEVAAAQVLKLNELRARWLELRERNRAIKRALRM